MSYKKIMMEYGHLPVDELPADIRARVERTPELRRYWEASLDLQHLLRTSVPDDPALTERMVFKVRSRLEQPSRQPEALEHPVSAPLFSPWRWLGLAACFAVAALGAYRLWMPAPTPGEIPVAAAPAPASAPGAIVLPDTVLAATDPALDTSVVSNSVPRLDHRRNSIDGAGGPLVPVFNSRPAPAP